MPRLTFAALAAATLIALPAAQSLAQAPAWPNKTMLTTPGIEG